jgi:uncharacterized protein (TIGR02265 family)
MVSQPLMSVVVNQAVPTHGLDLTQRLHDLPAAAMIRGVFFRLLKEEAAKRGLANTGELNERLRGRDGFRLYPARDLMSAYASAASLLDPDPERGLRTLFLGIVPSYAKTSYGQSFRKLLGNADLAGALRYLERARERVANYGSWRLETIGPCHMVFHLFDEYLWIESAQRGAIEGVLAACHVAGEIRVELDGPYRGAIDIRWEESNL